MPGGGKHSAEEWQMYRVGKLRCLDCGRYIRHTKRGRLYRHLKKAPS
jgi:hypothetical protein